MADYYTQFSMMIDMPNREAWDKAFAVAKRVEKEIEESDEGWCGVIISEDEHDGLWMFSEDAGEPEHLEQIVRAVVEECEIYEPIYVSWSWAHTCSKARLDAFGGGAMRVQRGKETEWIDAMHFLRQGGKDRINEYKNALEDLVEQADEDCPQEYRSKHFKNALAAAIELLGE